MTTIREAFKAIIPIVQRLATYPSHITDEMSVDSMRTVAREALGIIWQVPQNEIDFEIGPGLKQAMQGHINDVNKMVPALEDEYDIDNPKPLHPIEWQQVKPYAVDWLMTEKEGYSGDDRQILNFARGLLADFAPQPVALTDEQKQLCAFYSVTTLAELVAIQATHIDRLQKRLPKTEVPNYRSPREG